MFTDSTGNVLKLSYLEACFLPAGLMTKHMIMNTGMNMMKAETTSITECCLINTVERTMSKVSTSLAMIRPFFSGKVRWIPAATQSASYT